MVLNTKLNGRVSFPQHCVKLARRSLHQSWHVSLGGSENAEQVCSVGPKGRGWCGPARACPAHSGVGVVQPLPGGPSCPAHLPGGQDTGTSSSDGDTQPTLRDGIIPSWYFRFPRAAWLNVGGSGAFGLTQSSRREPQAGRQAEWGQLKGRSSREMPRKWGRGISPRPLPRRLSLEPLNTVSQGCPEAVGRTSAKRGPLLAVNDPNPPCKFCVKVWKPRQLGFQMTV